MRRPIYVNASDLSRNFSRLFIRPRRGDDKTLRREDRPACREESLDEALVKLWSEFFLQPTLTSVTFRCLACHIPAHLERKREGPDPVLQPSIGFECAQPVTSGGLNESDQQIVYVGKNGK
jgi:hypothetical protein